MSIRGYAVSNADMVRVLTPLYLLFTCNYALAICIYSVYL